MALIGKEKIFKDGKNEWRVVILEFGDTYGRNGRSVWKKKRKLGVEFWDNKANERLATYNLDDIEFGRTPREPFVFEGDALGRTISGEVMRYIREWLSIMAVQHKFLPKNEALKVTQEAQINDEVILEPGDTIKIVKSK